MAKKNLQKQYEQQLVDLERGAIIDVIKQNPEATLEEIYTLVEGSNSVGITLEEICGTVVAVKKRKRRKGAKPGPKPKGSSKLNTRTQAGRDQLDKNVLSHILTSRKRRWKGAELRKKAKASETQIRGSLTRLIEAGKVNWQGQTNQTRYFAA